MVLVRKLRYGNLKVLYAVQGMFSCSYLNAVRVHRCQITRYSCCGMAFHQSVFSSMCNLPGQVNALYVLPGNTHPWKSFSTMASTILVQARDPAKLSEELQNALDEHRLDDAWNLHEQHMNMEGFPRKSIVNKLLITFAQSLELQWLDRAYHLVQKAIEEHKQNLLEKETLIYLSLCLARYPLPVNAATILRKLVETEQYPPVTAWSAILAYMSQTAAGAYLAAELVIEIGFMFQDGRVDPCKKSNQHLIAMKPNTTALNIALAGCLLFGTSRKAEQILDMIPRIGVKADITLLIMMGHIYERNGRREELKKLKRYIDEAHDLSDVHFREFYNCLLSCHLKFGDLESASHMVLEMLGKARKAQNALGMATFMFQVAKIDNKSVPFGQVESRESLTHEKSDDADSSMAIRSQTLSYEDFCGERKFLKLEAEAKELLSTLVEKFQRQGKLITTERGILQPTETIFVKLIKAFLEASKIKELVGFLVKVEKEDSPVSPDCSPLVQVVNSCISLGWLDQAHDLLDEMRLCGVKTGSSVYSSLLKAYCKENRAAEVQSLLRDACKAGVQLDASCYEALIQSHVVDEDTQGALNLFKEMKEARLDKPGQKEFDLLVQGCVGSGEAKLMAKLLQEIKEGQGVDCGVHDWNNVIHFFSRKRLMQDAEKALKKMRSLGHAPNAQTFHSLVTGYAAIGGKYTEVTELWGEMKVLAFYHGMKFDQELLDSVLYTFVRGGFFIRANEVVEMMDKGKMFVDKYKYRTLFLKYHKTFCKGKAPKVQTESQLNRREAAMRFKKWVGLF
ncbi:pentatricopeptide repeat-containing protein At1g03100, mitochondrial isoform X1 [Cynara cardunculus var. scolymus]|uniref:pentatricopeptide repeat-containing protein At1g03100, mitochondrial isoform X1 n=1 Tax=Cynara cardunculus var. scolymus TaxID=59895 RepID=UPI000D62E867|nr:pentatricopeptide repeat-containing protein At1g03100, mitochondrial isoform X1 [Cynara cardunculus var. scolymus]XP_024960804.1 pentatricopeptide repeat-containing protein At1g03100, mitochondrial isoform X1 [Cynara cardunculus var. scolymus]